MNQNDEAIAQIHHIRHLISEEHGHNPQQLVSYYIELQNCYPQPQHVQPQANPSQANPKADQIVAKVATIH